MVEHYEIPQVEVEGFNAYYFKDVHHLKNYGKENKQSTGELLHDFFSFFANDFDWQNQIVSPRLIHLLNNL